MEKTIEVTSLQKSYGNIRAVDGISFYVEKGSLFSFLGPNGAGKSTTIDMICTLLKRDGGEIAINHKLVGKQDAAIRREIGIVFQDGLLDPLLTVGENLSLRAAFYFSGHNKIKQAVKEAATAAGVYDLLGRRYGRLSGGQRRRADIARALVHTPQILFLDEPTTGLDPQTRQNVWDTVRRLKEATGMTVFLTTHYMEEAAASDYVTIIDHGRIAAQGTPAELRQAYASDLLKLVPLDLPALENTLRKTGLSYSQKGGHITVRIGSTLSALPILEACRHYISGFEVLNGTMDDAFLGVTGKELREE